MAKGTIKKITSAKRPTERPKERAGEKPKEADASMSSLTGTGKKAALKPATKTKGEREFYRKINRELERSVESSEKTEAGLEIALTPQPLSLKEKGVLEFLETYISSHGVSPTYSEICKHFGFASFNSVQRYLKQLEIKGYIRLPWANQKRAITLLHPSSSALQAALQSSVAQVSPLSGTVADNVLSLAAASENFSLPLLGRVAAGSPIEAMEHDEFIDVPASLVRYADRTYALRVQGQSMIDDGILDGDVILVQRQSNATNGEIVVAMVGEEATVKRFYMHRGAGAAAANAARHVSENDFDQDHNDGAYSEDAGGSRQQKFSKAPNKKIELRPANSTMQSMWFDPSDVQIRGIVVGLIRKFF